MHEQVAALVRNDSAALGDIKVDCGVLCRAARLRSINYDVLILNKCPLFSEAFPEGLCTSVFDHRNDASNINIGARLHRWSALRDCWPTILDDDYSFDVPVVENSQEVNYLCSLLRPMQSKATTLEIRKLNLCYLKDPKDSVNLEEGLEEWWRDADFEVRQLSNLRSFQFVVRHGSEVYALQLAERKDFYASVPLAWGRESDCVFGVPIMVFSYVMDCLRLESNDVWKHIGHTAKFNSKCITLGTFFRAVRKNFFWI